MKAHKTLLCPGKSKRKEEVDSTRKADAPFHSAPEVKDPTINKNKEMTRGERIDRGFEVNQPWQQHRPSVKRKALPKKLKQNPINLSLFGYLLSFEVTGKKFFRRLTLLWLGLNNNILLEHFF